jgi:hypothetical protein
MGATQYLSLHPMTPWAELLRADDRRTRERALLLRLPIWVIKVRLDEKPLDLAFDNAAGFGLAPEDLVADDYAPCQDFAEEQRSSKDGVRAFLAPSAALPGTRNVVVLDPAVVTAYSAEPLGPEDLPTAMVAQDGRCPDGLWTLVHHRDASTAHAGFAAWRDGEPPLVFEEPAVGIGA